MEHQKTKYGFTQHHFYSAKSKSGAGFTLLEIMLAMGILVILAGISFVYVSYTEIKKQANDNKRIADITKLHLAVSDVYFRDSSSFMGNGQTVYVSLPDADAHCSSYTLPTLPNGWSYNCSSHANLQKSNGSGWLPIDFSPFHNQEQIPIDAMNDTHHFYAYIFSQTTGRWILTAALDSEKYLKQAAFTDGGIDDSRYEIGTDLRLWAYALHMVGYWKMDDANLTDLLGIHNGSVNGASVVPGKIGNALSFDGQNNYIQFDNLAVATTSGLFNTVEFWMYWNGQTDEIVIGWDEPYALSFDYDCFGFNIGQGNLFGVSFSALAHTWTYVAVVFYNGVPAAENSKIYINGIKQNLTSCHGSETPAKNATPTMFVADWGTGGGGNFSGLIDQLKVYSRELSAEEILALYNATK